MNLIQDLWRSIHIEKWKYCYLFKVPDPEEEEFARNQ